MCKIYGYCRVSTTKQSIERQIRNIKAEYPDAVIVCDEYTGTTLDRPNWTKLRTKLTAGDTVVFDQVSRMSRNADEGYQVYAALFADGVNLVFLKEHHIDTATYQGAIERNTSVKVDTGDDDLDFVFNGMQDLLHEYILRLAQKQIKLAFAQAEKEVQDLHQRTREGIETARLNGKQIGQTQGAKLTTKKSIEAKAIIKAHSKTFGGSLDDAECIKLAGISRNSFYKYKAELKSEM